jgi:hypothetical protein
MSESDYFQPALFSFEPTPKPIAPLEHSRQESAPTTPIAPLDRSSLETVLTMLALAETADELDILEKLTDTQQAQVLDALADDMKRKLCQLHPALAERFPLLVTKNSPHQPAKTIPEAIAPDISKLTEPNLAIGDRVVLKAKPHLTTAELLAIFEVVAVQEEWVKVRADRVGTRRYVVEWVLLYEKRGV